MTDKPKLLVLTSTFPRWQDDTDPPFVYELSRRLTDDFSVTVLTPHYPGALQHENLAGMEVHRFRYFFKKYEKLAGQTGILPTLRKQKLYLLVIPFFLLAQLTSLISLCSRLKPDIIHAHWLIPQGFLAALISLFNRTPFIVTAHGADVFGLNGWLLTKLKTFTLSKASRISVVSRALYQVLATDQLRNKLTTVPMGVDGERFSPALQSPITNPQDHPKL
ncbi:MAG: glycosyltransferase, partial [Pseudomonadota bacterium]|nr:glycosyltransferase [Pseudomonadota bacterium]